MMTTTTKPSRTALIAGFAAIYLIWGSTYLGIRVAVESIPPFLMAGFRFAVAGLLLLGYLLARGQKLPAPKHWGPQAITGLFLLLGGNAIVSWSETTVPSGITALVIGASPVSMVILDWLRPGGRRPTLDVVIGVVVGIAGVAILVGPAAFPAGEKPRLAGIIAIWLSTFSWWAGSLYGKHVKTEVSRLMASTMQMLVGCVAMFLVGSILGEWKDFHPGAIPAEGWGAFAYLIVAGSIIAYPVYVWLLEHSTPAMVSTYAYVNPVVAVVLGWAILGEPLGIRILLAAIIIIGAVVVITVGRNRKPASG